MPRRLGRSLQQLNAGTGTPGSLILRLICLITLTIFVFDTLTSFEIAVAVLYVLVIMLARDHLSERGLFWLTASCGCLTLVTFLLTHHNEIFSEALARCLVSLVAITVAGGLAIKGRKVTDRLREQLTLLSQSHDAIIVCGLDSRIRGWNSGAQALYGWQESEVLGRCCWGLLNSRSSLTLEAIKEQLLAEGAWEGELLETTRDGREVTILSRWSLFRDGAGRPRAILSSNNDVTHTRAAEAALHRAQAELAHVSRVSMLGELSTSIAHEVNQSLAAIVTNAEAALRWLDRDELGESREAIARTASNARRASEVIRQIRQLTRKAEPRHEWLDVETLVSESLTLLDREVQHRRIVLVREFPETPLRVSGDRIQLQQVMINLLMNGFEAIEAADSPSRELCLRLQARDGQVQVSVRDTGRGIDEAHLDRLFEAFFSTKLDGIGVGLSICRSIIDAHGGRIWAQSRPGEGATLSFALPMVHEECLA